MQNKIYVWDPLVRLFHWVLVLAFIVSYVSGEEESLIHVYSSYLILGLVAFRLLWGLVGSKHARFSDFIVSPGKTLAYVKDLVRGRAASHAGHNPLAGWMVITLLSLLLLTGLSGLKVYGLEGYGPLASQPEKTLSFDATKNEPTAVLHNEDDDDEHYQQSQAYNEHEQDEEAEDYWEEIHEFLANLTVLFIALHVIGVLISSLLESQNLVKAMITGYKKTDESGSSL